MHVCVCVCVYICVSKGVCRWVNVLFIAFSALHGCSLSMQVFLSVCLCVCVCVCVCVRARV